MLLAFLQEPERNLMIEEFESQKQFALQILLPYVSMLDRQSPEYTIDQLRENFLSVDESCKIDQFTFGLRLLLEKKHLRRLNDERLELTPTGREWFTKQVH